MNAHIISDGEYETEALLRLDTMVRRVLADKGFTVTEKRLKEEELAFCRGCFGCWVKTPGECVVHDAMAELNRAVIQSDVAVYLSPIVFGQYSANIKSAVDRWLPNLLPFFITRKDGATMHPARYETNPQFIIIGYGEDLTAEDARLFTDITVRHRENGTVLVYTGDDAATEAALRAIDMHRAGDRI